MNATVSASNKVNNTTAKNYRKPYIFALLLIDGRIVVGQASNVAKRVCAINAGSNRAIPQHSQVYRLIAVKDQNEQRTLCSVVKHFCDKYGSNKVIAV